MYNTVVVVNYSKARTLSSVWSHPPLLQGWPLFHQLLIDLFKFLAPFLRNAELTKPTQLLYKVKTSSV